MAYINGFVHVGVPNHLKLQKNGIPEDSFILQSFHYHVTRLLATTTTAQKDATTWCETSSLVFLEK